ncbi:SulP family inorganic anion transporter [Microscilla marina]|uniref:Sulfate transporter family protein n=1 Tax=Microscilla marina ATCC 23134 TaxID=313606 RepID=A1ZCC6_MICM2|nr:sulfate permease [Microscilla marina]EAY31928.1 sulfate transporter family protein [Microscilla marina ATCC 23134]
MNIKQLVPILDWLPQYKKTYIKGDVSAGLTVGIMLIPQGMAYAYIAGLPPVYGLYAALVPQIIYAFLGTSRQLSVGPVAMDSLLVASGVSLIAATGSDQYIALAVLLAFMMGALQLLFGVLRLGFLVNFLSRPVISGFTSAAAFIIGLNQLKHLMGVTLPRSNQVHEILSQAVLKVSDIHWTTFAIGLGGIVVIRWVKKYKKNVPAALVVVVLSILVVYIFRLDLVGVKIIQDVPGGLPVPALPLFDLDVISQLFPMALTLALIAFMEAISVAKAVQAKHKDYEIDPNQELIALGAANLIGAFFKSYPGTGGFSRTAVNDQGGAKTGVAALVSAALVALTLLFLTPLFYYLPQAVLASMIMVAVFGLIDFGYPRVLWHTKKDEFLMFTVTFITTLTVGIREGIFAGVVLSLLAMVYRTTRPHVAILGAFKGTHEYRNVARYDDLVVRKDVLILRYDASLYFANTNHFRDTMRQQVTPNLGVLELVIVNAESIDSVDSSAAQMLQELFAELEAQGIGFNFSNIKGPVRDYFAQSGLTALMGKDKFFLDVQSAVDAFDQKKSPWVTRSNQYAQQINGTF